MNDTTPAALLAALHRQFGDRPGLIPLTDVFGWMREQFPHLISDRTHAPGKLMVWQLAQDGWLKLLALYKNNRSSKRAAASRTYRIGESSINYGFVQFSFPGYTEALATRTRGLLWSRDLGETNLQSIMFQDFLRCMPIRVLRRGQEVVGYLMVDPPARLAQSNHHFNLNQLKQRQFNRLWAELTAEQGDNAIANLKNVSIQLRDHEQTVVRFVAPGLLNPLLFCNIVTQNGCRSTEILITSV